MTQRKIKYTNGEREFIVLEEKNPNSYRKIIDVDTKVTFWLPKHVIDGFRPGSEYAEYTVDLELWDAGDKEFLEEKIRLEVAEAVSEAGGFGMEASDVERTFKLCTTTEIGENGITTIRLNTRELQEKGILEEVLDTVNSKLKDRDSKPEHP